MVGQQPEQVGQIMSGSPSRMTSAATVMHVYMVFRNA
jgi:hypothetical protein